MEKDAKIYVAGHRGLVGSALLRALARAGFANIVTRDHATLDLRDQAATRDFFASEQPAYVFLAAATVGGIAANAAAPADFLYDNALIALNVMEAARGNGCRKLLYLGSSCIYPRLAPQPIPEAALLTGPLEPTNEAYALAKIMGIRFAQALRRQHGFDAISAMPCNLYGPNDTFHPENSHVIPALIRRFHAAAAAGTPVVTIWGSGRPLREFLHADDMAAGCLTMMRAYSDAPHLNMGSGEEISILDLARLIACATGFQGEIRTDPTRPDGTPRKIMDSSRLFALGWRPRIRLEDGIRQACAWYAAHVVSADTGPTPTPVTPAPPAALAKGNARACATPPARGSNP